MPTMIRFAALVAAAGLAAAAGCGSTTTGHAGAPAGTFTAQKAQSAAAVFPTSPDAVWQYEVTAHPNDDPLVDYKGVETVRVETVRKSGRDTTLTLRAIDTFTQEYRFPVLSWNDTTLSLSGVTYWGPMADAVDGYNATFLQLPLTSGKKWDDGNWIGEVKRQETVKVPSGTYQAYKVSVIGTNEQAYTAVGDYWIAPGVGIVKSVLSTGSGYTFESEMIPAGRKVKTSPLPKRAPQPPRVIR